MFGLKRYLEEEPKDEKRGRGEEKKGNVKIIPHLAKRKSSFYCYWIDFLCLFLFVFLLFIPVMVL